MTSSLRQHQIPPLFLHLLQLRPRWSLSDLARVTKVTSSQAVTAVDRLEQENRVDVLWCWEYGSHRNPVESIVFLKPVDTTVPTR